MHFTNPRGVFLRCGLALCALWLCAAALCPGALAAEVAAVCQQPAQSTRLLTSPYVRQNTFSYTADGITYASPAFDFHIFARAITLDAPAHGALAADAFTGGNQPFGAESTAIAGFFGTWVQGAGVCGTVAEANPAPAPRIVVGSGVPVAAPAAANAGALSSPPEEALAVSEKAAIGLQIGEDGAVQTARQSDEIYRLTAGSAPYLDITAELNALKTLGARLAAAPSSSGARLEDGTAQDKTVVLLGDASVHFLSLTAAQLGDFSTPRTVVFGTPANPLGSRVVVLNVDMAGAPADALAGLGSRVEGLPADTSLLAGLPCRVLWNLYDSSRPDSVYTAQAEAPAQIGVNAACFAGTLLAPGACVRYGAVYGSVIAAQAVSSGKASYAWPMQAACQPPAAQGGDEAPHATGGTLSVSLTLHSLAACAAPAVQGEPEFSFALFTRAAAQDEAGAAPRYVRAEAQSVQSLVFSQPGTQELLFQNLAPGQEYYLFETQPDGLLLSRAGADSARATRGSALYSVAGLPQAPLCITQPGHTLYLELTAAQAHSAAAFALHGTVSLLGRDAQPMAAGEFLLHLQKRSASDAGSAYDPVSATALCDANGAFAFEAVPFEAAQPTATYKLTQGATQSAGVDVDTSYYLVTVSLRDAAAVVTGIERYAADGTRADDFAKAMQPLLFENRYRPSPVRVELGGVLAEKAPDGAAMFELCTPDGARVLRVAANAGSGFAFKPLVLEKAETQTFLLRQQPCAPQEYDAAQYIAEATAVQINGALQATVTYRRLGAPQTTATTTCPIFTRGAAAQGHLAAPTASLTLQLKPESAANPAQGAVYLLRRAGGARAYWAGDAGWVAAAESAQPLRTDATGTLTVAGLAAGCYVLEQIQPAAGCAADTTPLDAVISLDLKTGAAQSVQLSRSAMPLSPVQELSAPSGKHSGPADAKVREASATQGRFPAVPSVSCGASTDAPVLHLCVVAFCCAAWFALRAWRMPLSRRLLPFRRRPPASRP